jgi:hypothetical protein
VPLPLARCTARTRLDSVQIAWLSEIPRAEHEVPAHRQCQLEARHPCHHAALGQRSGDLEWWICWLESTNPTVMRAARCPTIAGPLRIGTARCLLFEGHPYHHRFDMWPARSET